MHARQGQPAVCAGYQPRFLRVCGGAPPAASARRGCAEYPGRQTRRAGTSPVVTPAPGHRCCRCTGGGGVPLCRPSSGVRAARGARCRAPGLQSLCSQSRLISAAPASSGERFTCAAGESTGTTGPISYCFCFRPLPSCTASSSSRPSSGRAGASHHKVTGRGGNEVFSEGAIRPSPLPRAARRQRGAGQRAPAPVTPAVHPPVTPQPAAAHSGGRFRVEPLRSQVRP